MALSERERKSTKLTEALVLARTRAADLESVRKLNCWASQISDASIVRQMPNLEVCSLSVNNLSSLEDFAHCPSLQELYIRKNQVPDLSHVLHLQPLDKLRVLWLSDNPCSQGDNYRMTVLRTLPNLQKLDNVVVTEEEINRALEEGDDLTQEEEEGTQLIPDNTTTTTSIDTDTNTSSSTKNADDSSHTTTTTTPSPPRRDNSPRKASSLTPTPTSTSTPSTLNNRGSSSLDTSPSDDKEEGGEGEDSGVEVSSSVNHHHHHHHHFQPKPSEKGPKWVGGGGDGSGERGVADHRSRLQLESVQLSLEETNQIRSQLGLRPLDISKVTTPKSVTTGATKARNANVLQSVLLLVRELDKDSLEIVHSTVSQRLDNM